MDERFGILVNSYIREVDRNVTERDRRDKSPVPTQWSAAYRRHWLLLLLPLPPSPSYPWTELRVTEDVELWNLGATHYRLHCSFIVPSSIADSNYFSIV
ncbi:hypothetical protein E2C01_045912 [Portunus trituberculatus]|uniref:Uncharacterized protein n=1 Tax=Portunus trituberculatus TaxID=210409 RepID=A0A5B7FZI4_PORTR|nr:hypothetical protein [Portunus trituberculatus]